MNPAGRLRTDRVAQILVAAGVLLRLRQYLAAPPLWGDEAMVGINICARTYRELLSPLAFDQMAPIGFLWSERLVTQIFGVGELALRILPFVAGIGLLLTFQRVVARLLDRTAALVALALLAISPQLIEYGNEVKQYSGDALLAALVLLAVLNVMDRPRPAAWWRLLAIGSLAAVASVAAPLMLAAAVALVAATPLRRRFFGTWLLVVGAWIAIYAGLYVAFYHAGSQDQYLQDFWASRLLAFRSLGDLWTNVYVVGRWLGGVVLGTTVGRTHWLALVTIWLLIPLGFGARRVLTDRGWPGLALCLAPIVAVLAASIAKLYPIEIRTLLFTSTYATILVAAGIRDAVSWVLPRHARIGVAGLVTLFFVYPAGLTGMRVAEPLVKDHQRELIHTFLERHRAGDAIYVAPGGVSLWLFYTTDWTAPNQDRIRRLSALVSFGGEAFRNAPTRGRAVANEGTGLIFGERDWQELVGLAPGMGPGRGSIETSEPDPGWAGNEARRIAAAAHPAVWTMVSGGPPAFPALRAEIESAGLTVEESYTARGEHELLKWRLTPRASPGRDTGGGR